MTRQGDESRRQQQQPHLVLLIINGKMFHIRISHEIAWNLVWCYVSFSLFFPCLSLSLSLTRCPSLGASVSLCTGDREIARDAKARRRLTPARTDAGTRDEEEREDGGKELLLLLSA